MERPEIHKVKEKIKKSWVYPFLYPLVATYRRKRDKALFQRNLRHTDVFLIGHPKSGNTWMAYMLAILFHKDNEHKVTLKNIGSYVPVIHAKDSGLAEYSNFPDPRIFRNEMPEYPELYSKTIYLTRDPRAIIISYYHMYRTFCDDTEMTLQAFVEDYIKNGCIKKWEPKLVRWDRQVLTWLGRAKNDESVMIVKYEDMVNNRSKVLKEVAEFVDIPYTKDDLALAISRGSFEKMKKDEKKHGAESYPGEIGKRGRFIRRGKIDGWKDEMDFDIAKQIVTEFALAMKAADYYIG